ncbi:HAD superfamily hydrolase (TIGR01509 family) [Defluviimonas denitrificans]|jgi:HAD superfamily hydrolase (TIGR01509 family)|uniref:HAD superfamily hydrolase (TIGR01509 family) n=1 Tax=Albidovulum denitrificans TaxID=404881 RepID=A0A2S8SAD5_9RHOB|nr:HAD family hydrolase [Defluviimonas denitrificans]PQV57750.1 HAD superfamily hydrolase (TIGR01509 family) [Defluviimonas denitrificans]
MATDLVIFDCDGVLIDSEIISAKMLVAELARLGVTIDLDYVARHFLGRSYPTVMQQIREEFGLNLPEAFEEQYRNRLLAAFERDLTIMPGIAEVIGALAVPYCIATSSSPRRARRSLEIVAFPGLDETPLFTASMVEHGKPAPDLFLLAAEKMGVKPRDCLVIEDSLNGIRAAHAAGMEVLRFTGGTHLQGRDLTPPDDARPAKTFDSFARFFQIVPQLRRAP